MVFRQSPTIAWLERKRQEQLRHLWNSHNELDTEPGAPQNSSNTDVLLLGLPVEIVSLIFELACAQVPFHDKTLPAGVTVGWAYTVQRPEIVFSHVCRVWRAIALACPLLWTEIVHRSPQLPVPLQWLNAYLERSQNRPLDLMLHIRSLRRGSAVALTAVESIFEALVRHAARWRSLSLVFAEERHLIRASTALRDVSAPILEALDIITTSIPSSPNTPFPTVLVGAPRLSYVRMSIGSFTMCMPPRTVTTLELHNLGSQPHGWDEFLAILTIPTLVHLTLAGTVFSHPVHTMPPVIASSLTVLRLVDCPKVVRALWQYVRAPRLTVLGVFGAVHSNAFPAFIPQAGIFPRLTTLALRDCQLNSWNFLWFLAQVAPAVEHLVAQRSAGGISNVVDSALALRRNNGLWSRLSRVTYLSVADGRRDMCDDDDDDDELGELYEMVDWRKEVFGRQCVMRVDRKWLESWVQGRREVKGMWRRAKEAGLVEVFDFNAQANALWPPRAGAMQFSDPSDLLFINLDDCRLDRLSAL